jgi:hypothetical protein
MHAELLQALPEFSQTPPSPHVCGCWPAHCPWVGSHTPWHAPFTHVALLHRTGSAHCPSEPQLWTPLPEHCVVPWVQGPAHASVQSEHDPLGHATAGRRLPWRSQLTTFPPLHVVVPGVQIQARAQDHDPPGPGTPQ